MKHSKKLKRLRNRAAYGQLAKGGERRLQEIEKDLLINYRRQAKISTQFMALA